MDWLSGLLVSSTVISGWISSYTIFYGNILASLNGASFKLESFSELEEPAHLPKTPCQDKILNWVLLSEGRYPATS